MSDSDRIFNLLAEAKKLAQQYRRLTGKPLGITGEVAEYEAARHLGLTLTAARQGGYDAIERRNRRVRKLQIKGRCVLSTGKRSQMLGSVGLFRENAAKTAAWRAQAARRSPHALPRSSLCEIA